MATVSFMILTQKLVLSNENLGNLTEKGVSNSQIKRVIIQKYLTLTLEGQ